MFILKPPIDQQHIGQKVQQSRRNSSQHSQNIQDLMEQKHLPQNQSYISQLMNDCNRSGGVGISERNLLRSPDQSFQRVDKKNNLIENEYIDNNKLVSSVQMTTDMQQIKYFNQNGMGGVSGGFQHHNSCATNQKMFTAAHGHNMSVKSKTVKVNTSKGSVLLGGGQRTILGPAPQTQGNLPRPIRTLSGNDYDRGRGSDAEDRYLKQALQQFTLNIHKNINQQNHFMMNDAQQSNNQEDKITNRMQDDEKNQKIARGCASPSPLNYEGKLATKKSSLFSQGRNNASFKIPTAGSYGQVQPQNKSKTHSIIQHHLQMRASNQNLNINQSSMPSVRMPEILARNDQQNQVNFEKNTQNQGS